MSTQVQYRRGTEAQNNSFIGALAEITVDTTNKTLRVHDGATAGGSNIATQAYVDAQIGNIQANAITFGTTSMSIPSSGANLVANVAGTVTMTVASGAVGVGTAPTDAQLTVAGNKSASSWTTNGIALRLSGATYTDSGTATSGTAASNHINTIGQSTLAATNGGVITTESASLYIAGPPVAGSNMTITNAYALQVAQGNVEIDTNSAATSTTTGALRVVGGAGLGGNLHVGGLVTATGNITGGNLITGAQVVATGNITGGNLITAGLVSLSSVTKTGSNGVGNIGSSTSVFNTVFAKATSAQYADLAEKYTADNNYPAGTVVSFGGAAEVTISSISHDPRIAGVISTDPAFIMNTGLSGGQIVTVALTGRVPCQVIGTIKKGDRLVASDIPGVATVLNNTKFEHGCIIGKSLEDYDKNEVGMIEVVVGRL